MKFGSQVKGKITINIDKIDKSLNSSVQLKGLANDTDVTLTSLLVNFVSIAIRNGKDPKKIIDNNLENIISMVKKEGT